MKINTKKFVLGSLLTTCSLAIVSSITSTFAWYSYNTKNGLAFHGIASGNTEFLQVRLAGDDPSQEPGTKYAWQTSLSSDDLSGYSKSRGFAENKLAPVTQAMGIGTNDALKSGTDHYGFYGSPTRLVPHSSQSNIKDGPMTSADSHYVFFRSAIEFRCVNPNNDAEFYEKPIYISFIGVKASSTSTDKDVSKGLRLHINQGSEHNYLIAPGYTSNTTTKLTGPLTLDPNGTEPDKGVVTNGKSNESVDATYRDFFPGYDKEEDNKTVTYGNKDNATEVSLGTDTVKTTFVDGKISGTPGALVGTTKSDGAPITVNITMWLEGWDPVVINDNYKAEFEFAIQFECEVLNKA